MNWWNSIIKKKYTDDDIIKFALSYTLQSLWKNEIWIDLNGKVYNKVKLN